MSRERVAKEPQEDGEPFLGGEIGLEGFSELWQQDHVEDHTEEFLLPRDVVEDGVHWFLRCIRFGV